MAYLSPSPRRGSPNARFIAAPRRRTTRRAHGLGRRLRQLLVVVGAVGVLARRDARVLVVLLVRRRRVGGVVLRLGLGAVLLDHGREELLFLAFVLLEERRDLSVAWSSVWLFSLSLSSLCHLSLSFSLSLSSFTPTTSSTRRGPSFTPSPRRVGSSFP